MRNIPSQVEKFFELQHFDFDNSNQFLNSPDQTAMSTSSSSSQHAAILGGNLMNLENLSPPAGQSPIKGE